ncbi:MAG: S46 family peptidase, partial [Bacteroidales bacterium]|nr:S46 family peptidase [Bacteroidales bacterium]
SSIQKLSSVDHDYLKDCYWAMNRAEELPCPGLTVTFLEFMQDVTKKVEKAKDREKALTEIVAAAEKACPGCDIEPVDFYNENVIYIVGYKTYKDVRFVGAPPSSIGKFGADTDNWMWPRHTCDFSMFRIYAGADNEPADYSADNVPYTPVNHLKVSLKGVEENDFAMIMGYPGSTTRFQTSPELKLQIASNDIRIAVRTIRQDIMMGYMLADPAVKIKYASKYSGSSNGWKKWQGMKIAFDKLDIIGRAEEEEREFDEWASAKKKRDALYGSATESISESIKEISDKQLAFTLAYETLYNIEIVQFARKYASFKRFGATEFPLGYKDYHMPLDRDMAMAMLSYYRDNAPSEYALTIPGEDFANLDIDAYVERIFSESCFASEERFNAADEAARDSDIAATLAKAVNDVVMKAYKDAKESSDKIMALRKTYTEGDLKKTKREPSYPDANFTMRLTYGHVLPYSPKDAVLYRHYTTLKGVMEKEDPDNWEFVVPEKLKEIYRTGDFGRYAMDNGEMPACFLTNNDITGGNSGSPVMNADGELIGLAFDGNWESMSSDVMFEPDLQRCICVDIRYVLLIIDKFGGAGYLVDEMDIAQ